MTAARYAWMWALAWTACGADPQLQAARASLQDWESAQATADAREAVAHLEAALARDPGSLALRRALARQQVAVADLGAAISTLDAGLPSTPTADHIHLLRDRAAIHARAGDLDRAAADLRACIALGTDPRALGADPAYRTLVAHPVHGSLVPQVSLTADHSSPPEKVLVGETWTATLRVDGPPGLLELAVPDGVPPELRLEEVVEDVVEQDAFHVRRELRFEWRVGRAGTLRLPPLELRLDGQATTLPAQSLTGVKLGSATAASAPPGPRRTRLPVPSALVPDHPAGVLHTLTDGRLVRAEAHWSCTLRPRPPGAVRLVQRRAGQPHWSGWWLPREAEATWRCAAEAISLQIP